MPALVAPFGDLLASDSERYYFHATMEGLAAVARIASAKKR